MAPDLARPKPEFCPHPLTSQVALDKMVLGCKTSELRPIEQITLYNNVCGVPGTQQERKDIMLAKAWSQTLFQILGL